MRASVAMGSVIRAKQVPSAHRHHHGVVNSFGFGSDPALREVACIRVLSLSVACRSCEAGGTFTPPAPALPRNRGLAPGHARTPVCGPPVPTETLPGERVSRVRGFPYTRHVHTPRTCAAGGDLHMSRRGQRAPRRTVGGRGWCSRRARGGGTAIEARSAWRTPVTPRASRPLRRLPADGEPLGAAGGRAGPPGDRVHGFRKA